MGDAILRTRGEIGRVRGEVAYLANMPPTREEIEASVHQQVAQWASAGRPRLRVEGGKVSIDLPDQQLYATPGQALTAPALSASKLMAAWDPKAFASWILSSVARR